MKRGIEEVVTPVRKSSASLERFSILKPNARVLWGARKERQILRVHSLLARLGATKKLCDIVRNNVPGSSKYCKALKAMEAWVSAPAPDAPCVNRKIVSNATLIQDASDIILNRRDVDRFRRDVEVGLSGPNSGSTELQDWRPIVGSLELLEQDLPS